MSDTPEPGTVPDTTDSAAAEQPVPDDADTVPGREAAKWRSKLREVEAERDSLVGKVEALQRAQVDAHITALGTKPQAVWASGAQLADLVGDDGTPDQEKIAARSPPPANSWASTANRSDPLEED